jgi:hypothetical protein
MATEARDLNYLDDPFSEAPEATGGGCPDGQYVWLVDAVEVKESPTTGNPYLNWTLQVASPEAMAGRVMFHTNNIPTSDSDLEKAKQQLGFLKRDLAAVGVNVKHPQFRLSDFLNNYLNKLLDKTVSGNAKTKDDKNGKPRQNTYFDKLASGEAPAVQGAQSGAGVAGGCIAPAQAAPAPFDPFADE